MMPSAAQLSFVPPYCPNLSCRFHRPSWLATFTASGGPRAPKFYHCHGWIAVRKHPFPIRRFKCLACFKTFSQSFFTLDYRARQPGFHQPIFNLTLAGASCRHIGRMLSVNESTVRLKIQQLARQVLLWHTRLTEASPIQEPIVYDGLEAFAHSQFDPNNINHAIGKDSLFIYDVGYAPLNRKGRRSPRQKAIEAHLDSVYGRYPKRAIRYNTKAVLDRLCANLAKGVPLLLYSDRHFQYDRVVRYDLPQRKIFHVRIDAQRYRNYNNPLFAVNHMDLLARHHLAAFKRETIAFSKHCIAMIERYLLMLAWKNYIRPVFVKKQKREPSRHRDTPAMRLGIAQRPMTFQQLFKTRLLRSQVTLSTEWAGFFQRESAYSRYPIAAYRGA
jgi:transposase-like protein